MNSRRSFLINLVASAGIPALLSGRLDAQTPPPADKLAETDPVATVLGFKLDTAKVDGTKYPLHTNEQKCSGCVLYLAKPGEACSPCSMFGGKLVPPGGWCSVFARKP